MTPREFVIWFKGFTQAANGYNITPKQGDDIKNVLDDVETDSLTKSEYNIDSANWKVNTTSKIGIEDSSKVF